MSGWFVEITVLPCPTFYGIGLYAVTCAYIAISLSHDHALPIDKLSNTPIITIGFA